MADPIALLVGLGNPGARYRETRHNAGFWLADEVARRAGLAFRASARFAGELCEGLVEGRRVRLLKPGTYMNESGRAVAALARFYRLPAEAILVAHDDIDLPPGVVRLKRGGGDGGHKGLRDIIPRLGSRAFLRLRIGVGHPGASEAVVGYVLHPPAAEERALIEEAIEQALAVLPEILAGEEARAMNVLNRRAPPPGAPD